MQFLPDNTEKLILHENRINERIDVRYVITENRQEILLHLLQHLPVTTAIVFTNYKEDANQISELLQNNRILSSAFSSYFEPLLHYLKRKKDFPS